MPLTPIFGKSHQVEKTWGREVWATNNSKYCGKILEFKEGASFSMHYHVLKEETWMVLQGSFEMEFFDLTKAEKQKAILNVGDTVHLFPSTPHKLKSLNGIGLIFEVSTQHFDEDSYRIEKSS